MPIQELGFKSKIYYGIETEYTRRRRRYKAAKYDNYHPDMAMRTAKIALWEDFDLCLM